MAGGTEDLSEREKDVLRLMGSGHTAKSAAAALDLSVHTVNDYLREARKKLGVGSSREAARALAEREQAPPQKHAPEELGISGSGPGGQIAAADRPSGGMGRPLAWILAGVFMITTLLALAMMAGSHPVPATPSPAAQAAPAAVSPADKASEQAARQWIALVDDHQYEKSWDAAGSSFRKAVTAATWASQAKPVREPLGQVTSRELAGVEQHGDLPGMPSGDYRVLRFATDFAKAKGTVETVVMAKEDGAFRVIGYFIK